MTQVLSHSNFPSWRLKQRILKFNLGAKLVPCQRLERKLSRKRDSARSPESLIRGPEQRPSISHSSYCSKWSVAWQLERHCCPSARASAPSYRRDYSKKRVERRTRMRANSSTCQTPELKTDNHYPCYSLKAYQDSRSASRRLRGVCFQRCAQYPHNCQPRSTLRLYLV